MTASSVAIRGPIPPAGSALTSIAARFRGCNLAGPAARTRCEDALPDDRVRDLLPDRPRALVGADAAATDLEAVHHRRELRLLRGGRPAFCFLLGGITLGNQLAVRQIAERAAISDGPHGSAPPPSPSTCSPSGSSSTTRFFVSDIGDLLDSSGLGMPLPLLTIALPIGISFFTFQAITYVVDVKRGDAEPASLIDAAIYLSFFPHLVAGPIVRASEFLPQLKAPRDPQPGRGRRRAVADRARADQEGADRRHARARGRRPRVRRPRGLLRPRRDPRHATPTRPRSTATSPATPTSRSGSRCCWGSSSRRTSTAPTGRPAFATSGAAGT